MNSPTLESKLAPLSFQANTLKRKCSLHPKSAEYLEVVLLIYALDQLPWLSSLAKIRQKKQVLDGNFVLTGTVCVEVEAWSHVPFEIRKGNQFRAKKKEVRWWG